MFFFRPLFTFELIFAEWIFARKLPKRRNAVLRAVLSIAACFAVSFLLPYRQTTLLMHLSTFFVMFVASIISLILVFDAPFKNILLCAVAGYTAQHVASELYEMFNVTMENVKNVSFDFYEVGGEVTGENYYFLIVYLFIYTAAYAVAATTVARYFERKQIFEMDNTVVTVLSGLILIIDVVVSSVVTFVTPTRVLADIFERTDKTIAFAASLMLHFYNFLCCVLVLVILVEVPRRSSAEAELKIMSVMRAREKEQYELVKENTEVINVKAHDLKHRMNAVFDGKSFADEEREEISRAIDVYDSAFHTKNEALNVVLTEKSLVCKNKGVQLSCIIDASKLYFVKDYDVYSLFGNLLDNAIEAATSLEKDRRTIGLKMAAQGEILILKVFNNYDGSFVVKDGKLPQTTKKDKAYHGYGLKSIKHITEKYGGEMNVLTKDEVFTVTIILPIPRKNEFDAEEDE